MTILNSYVKLPEDRLDYIRSSNVHALLGQLQEVSHPFFAHPKLRSRESSEPISCDLIEVRFFQTKKTNMSVWGCIGISWDWMVVNRYNIYRYTVQWYMYTFTVNQNFRPESYIGFPGGAGHFSWNPGKNLPMEMGSDDHPRFSWHIWSIGYMILTSIF